MKRLLITGASRGIGLAEHRHFAVKGTEVADAFFKTLEALKKVDAALAA
mgnify:CR=1 FL=1